MKMYLKGFIIILSITPFLSNAQSISSTLKYINQQFEQYNEYETSFRIDESAKEIICEDKFGILKAKFSDVKFNYKGNNFGIYCLSDDKCIRYYGKDGSRKYDQDYDSYTMGLRIDDEIIPHIKVVVDKFTELKQMVLSNNSYAASSGSSSIDANLRYINQQFSLYNDYETSFSVDKSKNELICEDKFGILKASWNDVEVRTKSTNFGIFCLNEGSKCIRYYEKDGTRKYDEDYNNYTMGLRDNEKLIPHAQTVLDKFAEIKRAMLRGSTSYGSSNSSNSSIEAELRKINTIFQRSSEYKNTYSVNYSTKSIVSTTKNCKAIVPVKSGLSVNYYKRGGSGYSYGFYLQNSDKSILESCTSFEDYTEKTYEYINNYDDVQSVIRSLETIINLLKNSSVASSSNNTNTASKLNYINQQFSKYNAYNTIWSIDYAKKQLIWKNDFGTNYVNFRDLEIRADYENGWIGVYCLSGEKCIIQKTTSGSTSYYAQYTMSLNDNGKMIGHMSTVINEFAAVKKAVLRGASSTPSNGGGSSDDPDGPDK